MRVLAGCLTMLLILMLSACGGDASEAERAADEAAEEAGRAAEEAGRAAEEAGRAAEEAGREAEGFVGEALSAARDAITGGREVEPVAHRTLQELLPAELDGMAREAISGAREGAMGFFVTTATAEYAGDEGTIEISVVDLGGVSDPSMLGYAWTEAEVDRESTSGYERTVQYRGYRAHEQYEKNTQTGEMSVIVADRFIVAVEGQDVPMTAIKDALSRIDLDELEALRDAGVNPSE